MNKTFEKSSNLKGKYKMKTKLYALLASAALIAQAQAGGHHGGGGGQSAPSVSAPARSGHVSSFHSMPARNFSGSRTAYSGRHFSPSRAREFDLGRLDRSSATLR